MKQIRLLAFVMLCLFGFSVNAQDFEPRVAPESPNPVIDEEAFAQIDKTPQEFVVGEYYVIYNVGTQMYFSQGNNWGTRASIDEKHPLVVQFTLPDGKSLEDNALILNDYCLYNKVWKSAFFDSETAIFVDRGSQANYFWQVVPVGNKTYRLQASPANPALNPTAYPNKFVGRDESVDQDLGNNLGSRNVNLEALPLSPFIEAKAGNHVDWQFFNAPGWKEYAAQKILFDKSEDLRIAIEKGMDAGVEDNILTNAIEVYNNLESTVEAMDAQIMAIMKAINGEVGEGATASDPVDVTADLLVNADYENGNNDGWKGDAPAINFGALNAEFFNKSYTYFQPLQGIRDGVYSLSVRGYYRVGSIQNSYDEFPLRSNLNAKVFAKTAAGEVHFPIVNIFAGAAEKDVAGGGSVSINDEIFVPNTMWAAASYFDETYNENAANYDNTVFFVVTDGVANVGMRKDKTIDNDWTLFDNWTLNYYGNEADAYQLMFTSTKEAYQLPEDGYVVTRAYLEAFNSAAPAGSDAAAYVAALKNLESAYDTLTTNATLWVELDKVKSDAEGVAANDKFDPAYTSPLGEWALEVDVMKRQAALSNQELRQLIALKTAEVEEAQKHPRTDSGEVDMTIMLQNPAFDTNDWTGWTKTAASGGNVAVANNCAEAWNNSSFDIYQVVKNAPVGVYRISVQGFYRYGRGDAAYGYYQAQEVPEVKPNGAPVFVYLNEKTTPFKNVFDEPETIEFYEGLESRVYTANDGSDNVFPDQMDSSARAFGAGMFTQDAMGLVTEGQDMRIGVKGSSNQLGDSWVIFDNFKLTFLGNDVSVVRPELESTLRQLEELLNSPMSKSAYELLSSTIDAGYKAVQTEGDDAGNVMMNALSQLFKAEAQAKVSINIFMNLESANQRLENAINEYEATASKDVLSEARQLYNQISNNYNTYSIEDDQANAYISQVNVMIAKLSTGDGIVDGESYYFYNVATGKWLQNNNQVAEDWTTRAQVGPYGLDIEVIALPEGGYQLNPKFGANQSINGWDDLYYLYLDTNQPVTSWKVVKKNNGYYRIYTGEEEHFLNTNDEGFLDDWGFNEDWILVTKEERLADLATATKDNPKDATWLIGGHDFANMDERNQWDVIHEGDGVYAQGGDGITHANRAVECWKKTNFKLSKTITGIPNGTYQFQLQGFYRDGSEVGIGEKRLSGNETIRASYFANNQSRLFMSILDGASYEEDYDSYAVPQGGVYIPGNSVPGNALDRASNCFFKGGYWNGPILVEVTDGSLTIGVEKVGGGDDDWVVFDSFTLTYLGKSFEYSTPWTVAGVDAIFGSSWDPTDTSNDMTYIDENTLKLTKRNVPIRGDIEYAFKVVANHSWDESYPLDNYYFSVGSDGIYTLDIYFNQESKEINLDVTWVADAEFSEKTWTIAGVADVMGSAWDATDTSNDMTNIGDGYYELVKKGVYLYAYTEYDYKVVANHSWAENYGMDGQIDGYNAYFYVEEDAFYDVHFVWNPKYRELYAWGDYAESGDLTIDSLIVTKDYWLNADDNNLTDKPSIAIARKDNYNYWEPERSQYGALYVEGSETLSLNNFQIAYDPYFQWVRKDYGYWGGRASGVLVNNAQMRADNVAIDLRLHAYVWNFISLPFDVKVGDIEWNTNDQLYAIYRYDGKKRADLDMDNTWVRMTADSTLRAGVGYIWQVASSYADGWENYEVSCIVRAQDNGNKNNIFRNGNVQVALNEYLSEYPQDRSWNLIGNPYPSYFYSREMNIDAPFTVWNNYYQNYEAYSPLDDDYMFAPGEAFFFQRPINQETITFYREGRWADGNNSRSADFAEARRSSSTTPRYVYNLTLSGNEQSDRTRFVINEKATMGYELDKDASKFASISEDAIQLYTIEQEVRYAINERPLSVGEVVLGMSIAQKGEYTLKLETTVEGEVYVIDRLTGNEMLMGEEGYTFESEAGTFDGRFIVRLVSGETTGITNVDNSAAEKNYYRLDGVRVQQPKKGLYIERGKKVVVK